jgi:O-antigen/teichoic acid export membrane protein/SAM-dependent methyltransferase
MMKELAEDATTQMSLAKSIVQGVAWNHIGRVLEYGLMYLLSVLIARTLGAELNGIYAMALSVVQMLLVFSSFGLETVINSSVPRLLKERSKEEVVGVFKGLLALRLGTVVLVGLLFLLARSLIARLLSAPPVFVDLLFVLAIYFCFRGIVSLLVSFHIARLQTRTVAWIAIGVRSLEVIGAAFLLSEGYGLREIFFLITSTAIVQAAGLSLALKAFFFGRSSMTGLKSLLRKGREYWLNGLMEFILGRQADVILLSYFVISAHVIGQYDVAMSLAQIINFGMTTGLYGISIASFASVAVTNEKLLPKYWESLSRAVVVAVVPAFVFGIFFADILVPAIYSPQYTAGVPFFRVYAVALIVTRFLGGGVAADYFFAAGKSRILLAASGVSGLLNLALAFLLIPSFGAAGAVYATGISALVVAGIHGFYSRKLLKIRFPLATGFSIIVSSIASALLARSLGSSIAGENLSIFLLLYLGLWIAISYIVKPLTLEDIHLLRALGERPFRFAQCFARPRPTGSGLLGPNSRLTDRQKWAFAWMSKCRFAVDIGSSASPLCSLLARKAEQVLAVDTDRWALVMLKESKAPVHLIEASASSLPLPSNSVDTVLLLDVLEHVGGERDVIEEVHRILRPGGTLIFSVPHKGAFQFLDPHNLQAHMKGWFDPSQRHRHYSEDDLARLLVSKFRVQRKHFGGLFLYPLTFGANNFILKRFGFDWSRFFKKLGDFDNDISWGRLSYNLILLAEKI